MKWLMLIALFLLPLVSATTTLDLNITTAPSETFVIKLPIAIQNSIQDSQVILKRINVETPFEHAILRFDGDYYVYGIAPTTQANYTLIIKDAQITSEGQPKVDDLNFPITVEGDRVPYNLHPALVQGSDEATFVVTSFLDHEQSITTTIPRKSDVMLSPGENTLTLAFADLDKGLNELEIGMYTAFAYSTSTETTPTSYERIRFFPRRIDATVLRSESSRFTLRVTNFGPALENIKLQYNDSYFKLKPSTISSLDANASIDLEITPQDYPNTINDRITLTADNSSYEIPVVVRFTDNSSEVSLPTSTSSAQGFYCAELGGQVCLSTQQCSTSPVASLDVSQCCVGVCQAPTEKSYAWVGYIVGSIVLIVMIYVAFRYFKLKKPSADSIDLLKS